MATSLILLALIAAILTVTTRPVGASGVFELRFDRFENELGRDAKGHCCDGFKASSSSNGVVGVVVGSRCSEACRTQFRVCLKHYQTSIDLSGACTYGDFSTPVLGGNSLDFKSMTNNNVNNSISTPLNAINATNDDTSASGYTVRLPFEFSWPVS